MAKTYTLPEMPLDVNVWYDVLDLPSTDPPDAVIKASLSPIKPGEALLPTGLLFDRQPTHIIRCLVDGRMADNAELGEFHTTFPTTVFEYPIASRHFYVSLWYHECGAGFANWHARIYVARMGETPQQNTAKYVSWT